MRVLLAGASGVIGRELLRLLTDQGNQVIALSRHPADEPSPAATWVASDALIKDDLLGALAPFRADGVISQLTALRNPRLDIGTCGRQISSAPSVRRT